MRKRRKLNFKKFYQINEMKDIFSQESIFEIKENKFINFKFIFI